MAEIEIRTERVDDVPLLIAQQRRMGIIKVLNEVITPHANRKGLSFGALAATWLSFILSHQDHRMDRVEPWAHDHLLMLEATLNEPVTDKDFTDDRLADLLRTLGEDAVWSAVETALGRRLVRVYNLNDSGEAVRLDSTAAALYHAPDDKTLFRKGHSKDHRPDLAQVKVMLASLDPLGMPIATLVVVAGQEADDGLYLPAIQRAREVVDPEGQGGRLYIGDSKMAALATRATLAEARDFYLVPDGYSSRREDRLRELLEPVWNHRQKVQPILASSPLDLEEGERDRDLSNPLLAVGYETLRPREATVGERRVRWDERVLVIFSPSLARARRRTLDKRLQDAENAILALTPPRARGRRQYQLRENLEAAASAIFAKYRVQGLLTLVATEEVSSKDQWASTASARRASSVGYAGSPRQGGIGSPYGHLADCWGGGYT